MGLHLGARSSTCTFEGPEHRKEVPLPLGYQTLIDEVFDTHGSLALAAEEAIQRTEEALMDLQAKLHRPSRLPSEPKTAFGEPSSSAPSHRCSTCWLHVDGDFKAFWGREDQGSTALQRPNLERVFDRWFSLLMGADTLGPFFQEGKVFFAQLLVLRECMHHLEIECFELREPL